VKGTNEILVNQETMCEAVQFWLNSKLVDPEALHVVSVWVNGSYGTQFKIVVEEGK